ncbi:MAG: hypothetical protein BHV59_01450 [Bifidobacterium sp. 56_9_plus]|nr:MAG: hypothetical protein BHV59_01450 [Bifidobacterium sp. 56_9_plus]
MGRSIDEDELVEEIKSLKIVLDGKDIFPTAAKDTVLRIISEQPTAYDPDKVVEQLEDRKSLMLETFKISESDIDRGRIYGMDKAIEIVKAGGTDEV